MDTLVCHPPPLPPPLPFPPNHCENTLENALGSSYIGNSPMVSFEGTNR